MAEIQPNPDGNNKDLVIRGLQSYGLYGGGSAEEVQPLIDKLVEPSTDSSQEYLGYSSTELLIMADEVSRLAEQNPGFNREQFQEFINKQLVLAKNRELGLQQARRQELEASPWYRLGRRLRPFLFRSQEEKDGPKPLRTSYYPDQDEAFRNNERLFQRIKPYRYSIFLKGDYESVEPVGQFTPLNSLNKSFNFQNQVGVLLIGNDSDGQEVASGGYIDSRLHDPLSDQSIYVEDVLRSFSSQTHPNSRLSLIFGGQYYNDKKARTGYEYIELVKRFNEITRKYAGTETEIIVAPFGSIGFGMDIFYISDSRRVIIITSAKDRVDRRFWAKDITSWRARWKP